MFTDVLIQRVDFIIFFQSMCLFFCAGFSVHLFRRARALHWLWLGLLCCSLSFSLVLSLFAASFPDTAAFRSVGLSFHLLGLFFIVLFGAQCFPGGRIRSAGYILAGTLLILPACMTVLSGEAGFVLAARGGLGVVGTALGCAGALRLKKTLGEEFSAPFFYFPAVYLLSIGLIPSLGTLYRAAGGHLPTTIDFEPGTLCLIISTALSGAWAVVFARSASFGRDRAERSDRKKVIAFAFGMTAVGVAVTLGFTLTELMGERTEGTVREELYMLVSAVGNALDQEDVRAVSEPPYTVSRVPYKRMLRQLTRIRLTNKELRFIYLVGLDTADRAVVILLDTEPPTSDDYAPPGEVYAEAPEELREVFSSGRTNLVGPYTDRWGNWVSGFAPVKDEYGAILGVVGMDLDACMLRTAVASSRLTGIVITFLLAVIGAGVGLLIERNFELVTANARLRREVSWRVQAENELREARTCAEQASRAKGDFLARMSHEIRTPMNSIIGMADLALEAPPSETAGHVRVIADSARHLLTIINDVLDVSRIEAGKMKLESRVFELADLFESIRSIMDVQARSKGLELSFRIDRRVPEYFKGDPGRIRQIIINLVGNAIKFTDRGSVAVTAVPAGPDVSTTRSIQAESGSMPLMITVRDTGRGIPEHRREDVFKVFEQADGPAGSTRGGTGLGLTISRQLAELMGGTVWAERSEEGGSLFSVVLVLDLADMPPVKSPVVPFDFEAGPGPVPMSILLVEDNEPNAAVVEACLKRMGHTMSLAESGDKALKMLAEKPFDLVLMDVQMPGRNGIETTLALRSDAGVLDPEIPVIMLSAHARPEYRERSIAAGADDFITKPIDFNMLNHVIRRFSMRRLAGEVRSPDTLSGASTPPDFDSGRVAAALEDPDAFVEMFDAALLGISEEMAALHRTAEEGRDEDVRQSAESVRRSALAVGGIRLASIMERIESVQNRNGGLLDLLEEADAASALLREEAGRFVAREREKRRAEAVVESAGDEAGGPGVNILVVDDHDLGAESIVRFFEQSGHIVRRARDGGECLEMLECEPADVVFMDVEMPVMNGIEAARRIRSGEAGPASVGIPILGITGHERADAGRECLEAGMNLLLTKPVPQRILEEMLEKYAPGGSSARPAQERDDSGGDPDDAFMLRLGEDVRRTMADMRRALEASSLPDLARHAHHLANSLLLMQEEDVLALARELEEIAQGNDMPQSLRVWSLLKKDVDAILAERVRN